MRRFLLAVAALGVALASSVPQASAGEPVAGGDYAGSRITIPSTVATAEHPLTAEISRQLRSGEWLDVTVTLTGPTGLPAVCPAPSPTAPEKVSATGAGNNVWLVSTPASAPCNGVHKVTVKVMRCGRSLVVYCDAGIVLTDDYTVAARPSTVANVKAKKDSDGVQIGWTRSSPTPPDFLGYRVERETAKDKWTEVAEVGKTIASVVDEDAPTEGTVTYRVVGRRSAPPSGEITSTGGEVEIDLTAPEDTTTTTVPGQTDGGTGDGGTPDGGTGDGGTPTTGGGDTPSGGGSRASDAPRGRTGGFPAAPRLGSRSTNFPPLLANDPSDEEDGGFEEEIDYGEPLAGGGEDDLSSIIFDDDEDSRGMAVPVATGFVLAAWAFHLRFLARAARPIPPG